MTFLMQANRLNQTEIINALQREFTDKEYSSFWWEGLAGLMLILAVLGLTLQIISMVKRRRQEQPIVNNEGKLFKELMAGLRIAAIDQHVLKRLAKELQLPHPAAVLMSPQLFDEAVSRWPDVRGRELTERKRTQLQNVRTRLFTAPTSSDG